MSKLKNPLSNIHLGQCPDCLNYNLLLLQGDLTSTKLNKDGSMGETSVVSHHSDVVCEKCGKIFYYTKEGFIINPITNTRKRLSLYIDRSVKYKDVNPFTGE